MRFWQCLDQLGRHGAVRASWQKELGDEFAECQPMLRAAEVAFSIEDPEWPGRILDLEQQEDGNFFAFSQETPSHRPPLAIKRDECISLVPNLKGLADFLGKRLGFTAADLPKWSHGAVHEIGLFQAQPGEQIPVHLFVPNLNPREATIKAALCNLESSILLLPTSSGYSQEVVALAARFDIRVVVLGSAKGLEKLSIAPARKKIRGIAKKSVPPLFTPKVGWSWKDLVLSIEIDGLRCRIHGEERIRPWADMNIRLRHGRHPTRTLQILGDLGMGKRLTQRRSDTNHRKAISDVRIFLKAYVMPLDEDPFHEFADGWGVRFAINDKIGRRQVMTIEEEEQFAAMTDEDSPFTYQNDIDPAEMAGFTLHKM